MIKTNALNCTLKLVKVPNSETIAVSEWNLKRHLQVEFIALIKAWVSCVTLTHLFSVAWSEDKWEWLLIIACLPIFISTYSFPLINLFFYYWNYSILYIILNWFYINEEVALNNCFDLNFQILYWSSNIVQLCIIYVVICKNFEYGENHYMNIYVLVFKWPSCEVLN